MLILVNRYTDTQTTLPKALFAFFRAPDSQDATDKQLLAVIEKIIKHYKRQSRCSKKEIKQNGNHQQTKQKIRGQLGKC